MHTNPGKTSRKPKTIEGAAYASPLLNRLTVNGTLARTMNFVELVGLGATQQQIKAT